MVTSIYMIKEINTPYTNTICLNILTIYREEPEMNRIRIQEKHQFGTDITHN